MIRHYSVIVVVVVLFASNVSSFNTVSMAAVKADFYVGREP